MEDDYEGNFDTRRALVYTLRFTAKTMLYGPVSDVSDSIINKVSVGYIAGTRSPSSTSYQRDLTYSVVPRATKDYDGSQIATTTSNIDIDDASQHDTIENHMNEVTDKAFVEMKTFTASTVAIQSMHSLISDCPLRPH